MTIVVGRFRSLLDGLWWRADTKLAPLWPAIFWLWILAKAAARFPRLLIEPAYYPRWKWIFTSARATHCFFASLSKLRKRDYAKALLLADQSIALFKQGSGRGYARAEVMLTRAHLLVLSSDYPEALIALVDFIKALEFDRSLSRDDRQYLILFGGAATIEVLRRSGRYALMDELKPLWGADFSVLKHLNPSKQISRRFYFRPPAVPFEYKPEMIHAQQN